jgi:hypothetical protein
MKEKSSIQMLISLFEENGFSVYNAEDEFIITDPSPIPYLTGYILLRINPNLFAFVKNKKPVQKAVALLEENGFQVYKAEKETIPGKAPKPSGYIFLKIKPV